MAGWRFLFSDLPPAVVQSRPAMKLKALRFLPLAFLAGTHGFALFAPYAGLVLAALHLRSLHRRRVHRQRIADVSTPSLADLDEVAALPA